MREVSESARRWSYNILKIDENDNGKTLENIFVDGTGIMNFVFRKVRRVILEMLEILNLPLESINLFALHQVNFLIVNHIAKILNIDEKKVPFRASKTGDLAGSTENINCQNCCSFRR